MSARDETSVRETSAETSTSQRTTTRREMSGGHMTTTWVQMRQAAIESGHLDPERLEVLAR